jgi:hypothetical protein
MSLVDRLREHTRDNKRGMLHDLMFAVVWVGFVSILFDFIFVSAPTWAYYLFMIAGIPAYFGFFFSLDQAKNQ